MLTTLFHPGYRKSHLDLLNLGLLGLQLVIFFLLSRQAAQVFFFLYFAFWRAAYDGGLGWVLTKQSKKKWIVREVQRLGWLDEKRHPKVRAWIRRELADKMGGDYSFDVSTNNKSTVQANIVFAQELPVEYNAWLLFRQAVDVILVKCVFTRIDVHSRAHPRTQRLFIILHVRVLVLPRTRRFVYCRTHHEMARRHRAHRLQSVGQD